MNELAPADYQQWLISLKSRIQSAQQRAALAVNQELISLYWQIGNDILQRQQQQGWGSKVIDRLAQDLRQAFPDMKGFSVRNLKYMRRFAELWPDAEFVQQPAAQLPWFHICTIMDKLPNELERQWYMHKAIEHGWSRNVLVHQIESRLMERQGQATSNFAQTLPAPHSELAQQTLKDPYIFDFLSVGAEAHERDIEQALTQHISQFLLELGAGFAFVGKQVPLEIGGQDFYLDLLFYHLKLRCYLVIELKVRLQSGACWPVELLFIRG
jgi:predicted nuclease of restriction endonuclease-like (RecB) superfamily